jgi:hypothetical protein
VTVAAEPFQTPKSIRRESLRFPPNAQVTSPAFTKMLPFEHPEWSSCGRRMSLGSTMPTGHGMER